MVLFGAAGRAGAVTPVHKELWGLLLKGRNLELLGEDSLELVPE